MALNDGDIVRAALAWKLDGADDQVNVYHLQINNVVALPSDAAFAADLRQYFIDLYTPIIGYMSTRVVFRNAEVFNVTQNTNLIGWAAETDLDGTGTGNALPEGSAALAYLRTATPFRIGRKFLPTFTEAAQDGGVLESAALSAVQGFADAWADAYVLGLTYEIQAVVYDTAANVARLPIQGVASPSIAYQRRRRRGRGS